MKNKTQTLGRFCHFAAGLALGIATTGVVVADDTEVLIGSQLNPGDPNITFIIDTSGSMASDVVVGTDYDPQVTYTGDCKTDRLYWNIEGTTTVALPDCSSPTYIASSAYKCLTGREIIAQSGKYRDRHAQWNTTVEPHFWDRVARSDADPSGVDWLTECAADAGIHGDVDGDYYPTDGASGPWSMDTTIDVDWNATGLRYSFFSGNFLNWIQERGADKTVESRMEVVQGVVQDVVTPLRDVNIALMRFSTNGEGGMVINEMLPVNQRLEDFLAAVGSLSPSGPTPLAETLYEAGQYYAGRKVDFGATSTGDFVGTQREPLPSVPASQRDGNYISPITHECQRNYVVLLTDGFPTSDTDADNDDRIFGLPGFTNGCTDNCLDEMAQYLDRTDLLDGGNFPGKQSVHTYTIGFHTEQDLLERAATGQIPLLDDNGQAIIGDDGEPETRNGYFIANDQAQLEMAFADIIDAIRSDTDTFNAPALSVDTQNRLTNRDELYFAMFEPASRGEPHWNGNLKKYRLGRRGTGANDTLTILDAEDKAAVDENSLFVDDAHSYWSHEADAGDVTRGGFVSTLTENRNIYSNVTGGMLSAATNKVHENNGDLTAAMLDVPIAERDELLQWTRGLNPDGTVRQVIGDPLHSAPALLTYANRTVLFFGTNDGMLHAINPDSNRTSVTDIEHFAFIPRELLPQLSLLKTNAPRPSFSAVKAYGLDGPMTIWIDEDVQNGIVDGGDDAYLYIGMRRGGRNYYALDVSDINNPVLKWSIIGGQGDFVELGQSWSAPISSRIRWGGSEKQVLFFAGGNDTNQDSKNRPSAADDMGRAIYMVDAITGRRLWWASIRDDANLTLPEMTHSIPSSLRVFDANQDGLDDRIYVGDTGGKIWRFDINNANSTISGDVFADLRGGGEAGNRRFYSPPSVTRIFDPHVGTFLTVAIGTGHRAHPLERDVEDGFYLLRDPNVFSPRVNPTTQLVEYPDPIERSDLLDVTRNIEPRLNDLNNKDGWFIDFDQGEKSLSSPLTVLDRIFFTTYTPSAPQPQSCEPVAVSGTGRLYSVNILSGVPLQQSATPSPDDRYRPLDRQGIPPAPTLVFTPPPCDDCTSEDPVSEITMLVGTQAIDPLINNIPRKTYWVQEDIDR